MAEEDNMKESQQTPEEVKRIDAGYSPGKKARLVATFTAALGVGVASSVPPAGAQEEGGEVPAEVIDAETETAGAEIEATPESAVNLLVPTRENIPIQISGSSLNSLTPEQRATFNSQVGEAQDWIIEIYNYNIPELQDAVRTYVAAMGNNLRNVPDYSLNLGVRHGVISNLVPNLGAREARQRGFVNLNITNPGSRIRSDFQFEPMHDPRVDETAVFDFYTSVLEFTKYADLMASLPDSAFNDLGALRRWLRSDDVKFRFDVEIYKDVANVYDRSRSRMRELGIGESTLYKQLHSRWKFWTTNQRWGGQGVSPEDNKKIFWYQIVNDFLYNGKYRDRFRYLNVPPGEKVLEDFWKPLDIPQ